MRFLMNKSCLARAGKVKGLVLHIERGNPAENTLNTNPRGRSLKRKKFGKIFEQRKHGNPQPHSGKYIL